jgi:hypothetical protein
VRKIEMPRCIAALLVSLTRPADRSHLYEATASRRG